MECKYKPLRVPLINGESEDQFLSPLDRNDRNQLLSFLLGLKPSNLIAQRKIVLSLIFPCTTVDSYKISDLVFDSAKLYLDSQIRSLVQNKISIEEDKLRIRFIGINVASVLHAILSKDNTLASNILAELTGTALNISKAKEVETVNVSKYERLVRKRSYLASLLIDKSKEDRNFGRTKLAKLFYLADAHLKLNLEGKYQREAAGPLDPRLIYHEKWGIEKYSERLSFFKTLPTKEKEIVRYIPGVNIEDALIKAKNEYFEKYENINNLIELMSELDTEESEIVATLYACWNDLLFRRNGLITSDLIIKDFLENWHVAKRAVTETGEAKFTPARLEYWLRWMQENDLVPDGTGPRCIPKEVRIA